MEIFQDMHGQRLIYIGMIEGYGLHQPLAKNRNKKERRAQPLYNGYPKMLLCGALVHFFNCSKRW